MPPHQLYSLINHIKFEAASKARRQLRQQGGIDPEQYFLLKIRPR
jgi:hypothetical protein